MAMHDDHRKRVRERYLRSGLDNFNDIQALELLLFYAIPRRDTNPIAHDLIDRYGSLANVLEAPAEELKRVDGVGDAAAVLLSLFPAVARRHMSQRAQTGQILDTYAKCGDYLLPCFFGERDEVVYLLCLDAKLKVLDCRLMFRGSVNSAVVQVRKLAERALFCGATYVVLAHNHPGGLAIPSREDELTTSNLRAALEALEIRLMDHIIVAGDDYVSMAESRIVF